eukprot:gene2958-3530_t
MALLEVTLVPPAPKDDQGSTNSPWPVGLILAGTCILVVGAALICASLRRKFIRHRLDLQHSAPGSPCTVVAEQPQLSVPPSLLELHRQGPWDSAGEHSMARAHIASSAGPHPAGLVPPVQPDLSPEHPTPLWADSSSAAPHLPEQAPTDMGTDCQSAAQPKPMHGDQSSRAQQAQLLPHGSPLLPERSTLQAGTLSPAPLLPPIPPLTLSFSWDTPLPYREHGIGDSTTSPLGPVRFSAA